MDTAMTEDMGFLGMMQSLDAFFPVGAFTLSNGLEDYVLRDRIQNGKDLENYIQGFLQIFPYSDLGIVSLAYRNARSREAILELDAVGTVMKGASEVRNGSIRMGRRYMKARAAIGDSGEMLAWYQQCVQAGTASGLHSAAIGLYGAESGGDNLSATFSPDLADATIYVIDVAQGEKIPRKGGPGVTRSDLLVINKTDLAPMVGASLEVMARDSERMRQGKDFIFTNLMGGSSVDAVVDWIKKNVLMEDL